MQITLRCLTSGQGSCHYTADIHSLNMAGARQKVTATEGRQSVMGLSGLTAGAGNHLPTNRRPFARSQEDFTGGGHAVIAAQEAHVANPQKRPFL